ncbi:MAG: hypothetical protein DMF59_16275 [Acidobacteria bacterium]|nr:MAG: hypothetical protein DMF59_16275 [Acidobacteriota bacterium]
MSLQWILIAFAGVATADAATLTVNSAADDTISGNGLVTLREAVAAANADSMTDLGQTGSGADSIVFAPSLAGATIELSSVSNSTFGPSALSITTDITIDGAAAPLLTISRNAGVSRLRIFYVASGGTLRLRNVTLANGVAMGFDGGATHRGGTGGGGAGLGGAIFNEGTVEIVKTTLVSNQATGGNGGPQSAIFDTFPRGGSGGGGTAGAGGAPTGADAAFDIGGTGGAGGGASGGKGGDPCSAGGNASFGGAGGGGGGCANSPACGAGSGGFGGGGGGGGGGQTGQPAGAGAAGGFGAGNGGNGASSGEITTPGGGGGGGGGMGGAVFNHGGMVIVTNSTFSANSAHGGAGGRNGAAGQGLGGGIFNRNGTLTVLAATFSGNVADQGGGVYNLGDGGTANATINGTILANSSSANDLKGSTRAGGAQTANGTDNLIESQSGFTGSITSTADPQLGALANNDGPTRTHKPALTSPAVDASMLGTPAVDQRGVPRPDGAFRDIGSVEFVHNHPPVAVCKNVTVNANAQCVANVSASAIGGGSSDPDGDPITLQLSPAGPFSLGTTGVTLTVTDNKGASASCQATVTVVDATPPAITCPANVVLECPANTSPSSTGMATAVDNCSTPTVSFADVSVPGCGGTVTITRTWIATDAAGNSSSCVQTVRTVDTTPPTIIPGPDNAICLWPANGKYVYINNVTGSVQIVDACDPHPTAATISCVSSQCDDAPCADHPGENGDGNTVNDCVYDASRNRSGRSHLLADHDSSRRLRKRERAGRRVHRSRSARCDARSAVCEAIEKQGRRARSPATVR